MKTPQQKILYVNLGVSVFTAIWTVFDLRVKDIPIAIKDLQGKVGALAYASFVGDVPREVCYIGKCAGCKKPGVMVTEVIDVFDGKQGPTGDIIFGSFICPICEECIKKRREHGIEIRIRGVCNRCGKKGEVVEVVKTLHKGKEDGIGFSITDYKCDACIKKGETK